ncbi:unnamed protein product, partial [marine sediment metagenome]
MFLVKLGAKRQIKYLLSTEEFKGNLSLIAESSTHKTCHPDTLHNLLKKLSPKKLGQVGPFVDGSMVKVKRRCGNKRCKCYLKGQKHESYYLHYKVKGITKAVYIPVDLEDEVKKWNQEYKKLKEITSEISKIN